MHYGCVFFFYLRKRKKTPPNTEPEKPAFTSTLVPFAALKSILRYIFILTQLYFHKLKQEIALLPVWPMGIRVLNLTKMLLQNPKI